MTRIVLPVAGLLLPFLMGCCCDGTCRRSACNSYACNPWYTYTPGCRTGIPNYADIPQIPAEAVVRNPVVAPTPDIASAEAPTEVAPEVVADIPVPDEAAVAAPAPNSDLPDTTAPADELPGDDVPGPPEVAPADGQPTTMQKLNPLRMVKSLNRRGLTHR